MKKCPRCIEPKLLSDFPINRKRKDGRGSFCLEHQREYVRNHYKQNKTYYIAKAKKNDAPKWAAAHALILATKIAHAVCPDCGMTRPPCALEFDHVRGKKLFNIADYRKFPMKKLVEEMAKCEIVCAACHAERTHNRKLQKP